jgi:hypothetical protein
MHQEVKKKAEAKLTDRKAKHVLFEKGLAWRFQLLT